MAFAAWQQPFGSPFGMVGTQTSIAMGTPHDHRLAMPRTLRGVELRCRGWTMSAGILGRAIWVARSSRGGCPAETPRNSVSLPVRRTASPAAKRPAIGSGAPPEAQGRAGDPTYATYTGRVDGNNT